MSHHESGQRIEQKEMSTNAEIIKVMRLLLRRSLTAQSSSLFR